jgi:hypothetical protein
MAASMVATRFGVLGCVLKNSGGAWPPDAFHAEISITPINARGSYPASDMNRTPSSIGLKLVFAPVLHVDHVADHHRQLGLSHRRHRTATSTAPVMPCVSWSFAIRCAEWRATTWPISCPSTPASWPSVSSLRKSAVRDEHLPARQRKGVHDVRGSASR